MPSPNNGVLGRKMQQQRYDLLPKPRSFGDFSRKQAYKAVSCSHGLCSWAKNEGKSTAENPLDVKASTRIVVPGYTDPDVVVIRRDLPNSVS